MLLTLMPAISLAAPSTQPAAPVKTGELDLTFTERSPISAPKEMARRLNLKDADLGEDYDISKCPFKAYVPTNYDPKIPVGIFVYLGYKETTNTPPDWRPVLDKSHMIFISPVCHAGTGFLPVVPQWQALGLAMDAVHNLQHLYSIDTKRIYCMLWHEQASPAAFGSSDVFDGFVLVYDSYYFQRLAEPNGTFYPATFSTPPSELYKQSLHRGYFLIEAPARDQQPVFELKLAAMKRSGFTHLQMMPLSSSDDLHFPNMKADWFEQKVLPFLDDAVAVEAKAAAMAPKVAAPAAKLPPASVAPAATAPSQAAAPAAVASPASIAAPPPSPSPAAAAKASPDSETPDKLLLRAQLLINNNQNQLAADKLKQIIRLFPDDPAATKAKQMLDQLGDQ
jgi:hypothetical protein